MILDNADITCTVASGIVVYNAYECGSDDTETATKDVDTTNAGVHIILADDSENTVNGSHVAKIYKEGTTQEDVDAGNAKKQWKFDAAIDSLVSIAFDAEEEGTGTLAVNSDNEGIETSLHLTINGGTVLASGNMYDEVSEDSEQAFVALSFADSVEAGQMFALKNADGEIVNVFSAANDFQTLVYSSSELTDGDYTLYEISSAEGVAVSGLYTEAPSMPDGELPDRQHGSKPEGEAPDGQNGPDGQKGERPDMPEDSSEQASSVFTISGISNAFSRISEVTIESSEEESSTNV